MFTTECSANPRPSLDSTQNIGCVTAQHGDANTSDILPGIDGRALANSRSFRLSIAFTWGPIMYDLDDSDHIANVLIG